MDGPQAAKSSLHILVFEHSKKDLALRIIEIEAVPSPGYRSCYQASCHMPRSIIDQSAQCFYRIVAISFFGSADTCDSIFGHSTASIVHIYIHIDVIHTRQY